MKLRKLLTFATLSVGLGLTTLQAQSGKSLDLNGTDQYMSIPNHDDFNISKTENFTVSLYIKTSKYTGTAYPRFVSKRLARKGNNTGYELWGLKDRNHFFANTSPNENNGHSVSMSSWSDQAGALNTWVHIAMVVDRAKNKMYLYQDGILAANSGSKQLNRWFVDNPYDVIIGATMSGATDRFGRYFNGSIDNLRFWKRALTADELKADMKADRASADGLVAEYDFENITGNTVPDISGNANKHNGTLFNYSVGGAIDVASFTVAQNGFKTGRTNKNETILKLNLQVTGDSGERPTFSRLKMTMEGTTAITDVEKINVLLSNDDGTKTIIGTAQPKEGEIIIELDKSAQLGNQKSVLSLAYDVKADAIEGNKLDAKLLELTMSNKSLDLSAKGNPSGDREILLARKRLFAPMDYNSRNYRIPAIITAKDGSLVTMTDKRKNNEADLPEDIDILVRRSTDNGLTWSEPVTVAEGKGRGKGFGDAALVMAKDGTLIATFVGGPGLRGGTSANPNRTYISKSTDNGVTWSAPTDITDQIYGANCSNDDRKSWGGVFCASGNGLCTREGRIMFVAAVKQGNRLSNYLFYSDDKGDTWHVSAKAMTGGDEAKVIELNNNDLLMSIRRQGGGERYYTKSSDKGQTWTPVNTWSELIEPNCNGDMIYYTSKLDGYERNRVLHSIPNHNRNRKNVSVFVSYDEGNTWNTKRTLVAGSSAYSSLCKLQDGTIGIYVEETDPTTASGYSLYFMNFSLNWLTKGKDQYHAPNSGVVALESPTFTPNGSEKYVDEVTVTINHATEGVTLHYTLDGTTPTEESPVYTAPIKLTKSTTIKVFAVKAGTVPSEVTSAYFRIRKANEYETWDETAHPRKGTNRVVQSLTIEGASVKGEVETFTMEVAGEDATSQSQIVYDKTAEVLKAMVGNELSFKPKVKNLVWMHYYVYVDWNHNMEFDADELVSFSHFSADGSTWVDSKGNSVQAGTPPSVLPSFIVPTTAKLGKTRVRFKVDWNSKDPNGNTDPRNLLSNNNGTICDFTIEVMPKKTAIEDLSAEAIKVFFVGGKLHIQGLETSAQVAVYNTLGQLLESFEANDLAVSKDLDLAKGIYIITVKQKGKTLSYKVSL